MLELRGDPSLTGYSFKLADYSYLDSINSKPPPQEQRVLDTTTLKSLSSSPAAADRIPT